MRILVFACVLVTLSGCAGLTSVSDNEACVVKMNIPAAFANCVGAYDVVYKYRNPSKPPGVLNYHTMVNDRILQNYSMQDGDNHCYAAALQSSFSMLGTRYTQPQFAKAISQECFGSADAPLTFSQIVFAATRVHAPPGIWYADTSEGSTSARMNQILDASTKAVGTLPGPLPRAVFPIVETVGRCQGSNGASSQYWIQANWDAGAWASRKFLHQTNRLVPVPDMTPPAEYEKISRLNLYEPITWHFNDQPPGSISGAIVPIGDSRHLIDTFQKGVPVIAGLVDDESGHVVLVNRMQFASVPTAEKNTVTMHPSGYIAWVEVADPKYKDRPLQIITGDEFLAKAKFIFAIYQDARS